MSVTVLTCVSGLPCRQVSGCHCDNCRLFTAYPVYTFEVFRPAYPQTGRQSVLHRGDFEANRDSFSPSLVFARDFYARDDAEAATIASEAASLSKSEHLGFNDECE